MGDKLAKNLHMTGAPLRTRRYHAPINPEIGVIIVGTGVSCILKDSWIAEETERSGRHPQVWTLNDDRGVDENGDSQWGIVSPGSTLHWNIHKGVTEKSPIISDIIGQVPIMTRDILNPEKKIMRYPFDKVRRIMFGSTPDYMLAFADMIGAARVYLPGADYTGPEYAKFRNMTRAWLMLLEGKGVEVNISPFSKLWEYENYE